MAKSIDLKLPNTSANRIIEHGSGFWMNSKRTSNELWAWLLGNGKWPLIVFIDNLGRCAPPKPVEIVEAPLGLPKTPAPATSPHRIHAKLSIYHVIVAISRRQRKDEPWRALLALDRLFIIE
jgi:hypothetical protein